MGVLHLDRRQFLAGSVGSFTSVALAGCSGDAEPVRVPAAAATERGGGPGPCLVLIQLTGGNDGHNTLVPYTNPIYHDSRPRLAYAESQVQPINERLAFSPQLLRLPGAADLGNLGAIEGVGYPDIDRSHFRSTDIWQTARRAGRTGPGWIGRLMEARHGGRTLPERVIHVGPDLPYSLKSDVHRPLAFCSEDQYQFHGGVEGDLIAAGRDGSHAPGSTRALLAELAAQAAASTESVRRALEGYEPRVPYPPNEMGGQLRACAALIEAGVGAEVLSLEQKGYDTHVLQQDTHPRLLLELDSALSSFLRDIGGRPNARRVLVVAFSEFGRRLAENASVGTDHGSPGPVLIAGPAAQPGLHGREAVLEELDEAGDPLFTTDFRAVYGTIARDLFGVDPEGVVGGRYQGLEFIRPLPA